MQRAGFGDGTEFFSSKLPAVLSAQQEIAAFKDFEHKEVAYWESLLSSPSVFKTVEKVLLVKLPTMEIASLRKLDKAKLSHLALKLREIDKDRLLVAAVEQAVQQFSRNKAYLLRVKAAKLSLQKAKNRLVTSNLRLVILVATKYPQGTLPHEDLVQEGTFGLIKAIDRFDPNLGYRFSTYATWWIRKVITTAIETESLVRLPVELSHKCLTLSKVEQKIATLKGYADVGDIAKEAKLTLEQLHNLRLVSTYKQYASMEDRDIASQPDEASDEEEATQAITEMLASLPVREAKALTMYFGLGRQQEAMSLREVGLNLNVTGERAKQIKDLAFSRLRKSCKEKEASE